MTSVEEINDFETLAGYRLAWNSWLAATPRATFCNSFDWLKNYWQHFGDGQRLRALVVRSGTAPIGVLPLVVRRERRGLHQVRVLTYPHDGWGSWYGPVGSNSATTMLAAMQYLRQAPRDWDMIDLAGSTTPSHDAGRVGRSMRLVGLLSGQTAHATTSHIDLSDGWQNYLCSRTRKTRHELRRIARRVFERGDVEYIRHRPAPARAGDGDPRWDLFAMCQQVALASWQAASTTGTTLTHPAVCHFLRDAHALAARNGMLDLNLLLVDGQPAAFAYNYHCDGRLTGLRVGYDGSLGRQSLGTALFVRMIEDSCTRGDTAFDLGAGDVPFKRRLRTHAETTYRMTYMPLTSWRSQVARLAEWLTTAARHGDASAGKAASA